MSNYQSDQIKLINTSLIDPHPDNPRKQIGDVTDLAASTIELRALAAGRADDGIVAMAAGLRANCTSCLVLVDGLMQEGVSCE